MNYSLSELRSIAQERGLTGYSKLRKADLIALLNDNSNPVPVLTPTVPVKPKLNDRIKKSLGVLANRVKSDINAITNWIGSYIPQAPMRVVNEKLCALKTTANTLFNTMYAGLFGKKATFEMEESKSATCEMKESKSAIKGFAKQYTIDGMEGVDAMAFLNTVRPQIISLLSKNLMTKINMVLTCVMERVDMKSGEVITAEAPFVSKTEVILEGTDVSELYVRTTDKILESMANFQKLGSNWRFKSVVKLDINTVEYKPLKGSSYIPLPKVLANKKAIINMQNKDDQCFKWCVTRAMNPVEKTRKE